QGDGRPAARLLLAELEAAVADVNALYLCCVNRGVLDDALIHAIDEGMETSKSILEAIAQAVSLAPNAPSCWPLEAYPTIAVWPMAAESLVEPMHEGALAPAASIMGWALDPSRWPEFGACPAGEVCPYCNSRKVLSPHREFDALAR